MTRSEIRDDLLAIVSEIFGVPASELPGHRSWEELGADSFDLVEFFIALRERFELDLQPAEFQNLHTLDEIVDYLASHHTPMPVSANAAGRFAK
jgi:acyl carrier protein